MTATETRTLFEHADDLQVIGEMHADDDGNIDMDFETPEQEAEYREYHEAGRFVFVGLVVKVIIDGVTVGEDSLWGIEHGTVGTDGNGKPVKADAWEFTPATYAPGVIIGGSCLNTVAAEALDKARGWLERAAGIKLTAVIVNPAVREGLELAGRWVDPNRPAKG